MDYQRFIQQLPELYENWGQESVRPKSDQFQAVLDKIQGTTANVMTLLNFAVECMETDEVYCEIGCFQGSTLIGALFNHPETMAYAADNFSEVDADEKDFERLIQNLCFFNLEQQVIFCNQDFEEFFFEYRQLQTEQKIGVYLYNGSHDYRSQLLGLLLVRPFLADQALIIVDDSNFSSVQQANWDFMAAHTNCQFLLDLPTPQNESGTFGNRIHVLSWDVNQETGYTWSTISATFRNKPVIQAIYDLHFEFEFKKKEKVLEALYKEASALQQDRNFLEAEQKYKEILDWDRNQALAWHNLGIVYYETERYQDALAMLLKSLESEGSIALHHYSLGLVLEKIGNTSQAIRAYEKTIALNPQIIDAYNNLGNIFHTVGEVEQAEAIYRRAIAANPDHSGSYLNLGNVLIRQGQIEEAIAAYEAALKLPNHDPDVLNNLSVALELKNDNIQAFVASGDYFYERQKYHQAIKQYKKILESQTGDEYFYLRIAQCYEHLRQYPEAIEVYNEGIRLYPAAAYLYLGLVLALTESGNTQDAIEVATRASLLFPDNLSLRLKKHLTLPVIYKDREEINFYRHRFTQGLDDLIQEIPLGTSEAKQNALKEIGQHTNFFLACQGLNDLDLQQKYGQLVHRIMAVNYPQWTQARFIPPRDANGKIRIGYISGFLWGHTVGKLTLGWLRHYDRNKFEVYCYHINSIQDQVTQLFKNNSDKFHHIPGNIEAVCKQIIADSLHVLTFLDIGMEPQMTQLASLRVAPIQCTTWAHPETSGLPTIDYFLSSDLMEPKDVIYHYSEQLVRLPNIGISYPKPTITEQTKTRADFQLHAHDVVYLSCQTLFKYLPQYDYVFAAITQRVPGAKFVFISRPNPYIAEQFRQRLQIAFSKFSLNSEEHCVILPVQNQMDYWNVNLVSDIFLDTLGWSGGNTTLEAIACNLPVVTCPSEFMRGRHAYGILKMLGLEETIALDEAQYIEIAVRLGLDPALRQHIVQRIMHSHQRLYDDKTCVAALEDFYQRVVQSD